MWMLSFVPDSFLLYLVNIIFYTGLVCTILGFLLRFKFLANYQFILQVVGILALAFGLYFKGGFEVEMEWRERVKEMEAKVAAAEEKSKQANAKIETKVVEKVKVIKQNVEVIKKEIQVQKEIINQDCLLNDTAIDMYNQAVTNSQSVAK
jgi:hypothetical protein